LSQAEDPTPEVGRILPEEKINPGPCPVFDPVKAKNFSAKRQGPITIPITAMNGRFQNELPETAIERSH
jgi:hypothetical protein